MTEWKPIIGYENEYLIAAFCLFSCAVFAFCTAACKITAPKLKSQEGALKCEIEAQ